jgi:calcineurin-like phosphoesterase
MGRYLDGRATVVAGTHTHVQTADLRKLPGGTLYVTDLGMCGSMNGVIGVRFEEVRQRFLTGRPGRLSVAEGEEYVCGIEIELDPGSAPLGWKLVSERI